MRKFTKPVEVDLAARTLNGFPFHRRPHRRADPRPSRSPTSTARCASRSTSASHTFFLGEVVDAGFLQDEDTPVLRMEDTRMNYGG